MKIFIVPFTSGDRWEMSEGYVLAIAETKEEALQKSQEKIGDGYMLISEDVQVVKKAVTEIVYPTIE